MSNAVAVRHGDFGRAALYNLDRDITVHAHREGHLVFRVDGPICAVTVGETRVTLEGGWAAAISPWEPHSFSAPAGAGALTLVLYIKPVWFLEASRTAQFALSFGRPRIELTGRIRAWVSRLCALLLAEEGAALFDGYLYELTRECFDQSWQWTPDSSPLACACGGFRDYRVRKSMKIMADGVADDLDLDGVARAAGLSRPHFFKLFRKQMGITPNLYLNTLRTERAIGDLTASEKTVTDIGVDLGFSSQASFSRFFTANVGIPPSDYRRAALTMLH